MRVFIAIELPSSWHDLIKDIQHGIYGKTSIRWVNPVQAHLTVKFLGDIPPQQIPAIQEQLTMIANRPPLLLETKDLGSFPSVIWLGLKENADLLALACDVETALVRMGFTAQTKEFKAHITIGRLKTKPDPVFIDALSQIKIPSLSYQAQTVSLFQSMLTSEGPLYQALSRHSLKAK